MANPENKQIPYESTQKDIRDAIESVATAIGGIAIPSADHVSYDNSGSGLSATDVQNAIDEIVSDIPTVNDATLTIQKNGSDVATFTANASSNVVANVTVPTTTSELTNNSDFVSDASYVHTDNNFTNAEKTKLGGIESGAEVNVQSDWNEADNTKDDYIKNKPSSEVKSATDTFTTVNGGLLEECNIDLVPVQDLHGYDHPWVGGAGKNKLPLILSDIKANNIIGTWNGNIYTIFGIAYTITADDNGIVTKIIVNGTADTNAIFQLSSTLTLRGNYILNGCPNGGGASEYECCLINTSLDQFLCRDFGSGVSISLDQDSIPRIVIRNGVTITNLEFYPMLRLSTESDPTFEPYSNICPITGHTEVDFINDGKNKLPFHIDNVKSNNLGGTWSGNIYTYKNVDWIFDVDAKGYIQKVTANGLASAESNITVLINDYIKAGTQFKYNGVPTGGSSSTYQAYIRGGGYDRGSGNAITPTQANIDNDYYWYRIAIANGYNAQNVVFYPMIYVGDDATYEPYFGHLYQVQIGSTVYGGYVDLVSGVMTVDRAYCKLADQTLVRRGTNTSGIYRYAFAPSPAVQIGRYVNVISNALVTKDAYVSYERTTENCITPDANGNYINFYASDKQTDTAWITFATNNDVEIVYPLATPQTIQLTPQQIETLSGQNNLSTPLSGQSIETNGVEYKELFTFADVKEYVDKKIPDAPTTDGTYTLQAVVSGGVPTYSWV